jgi:hypothetical protein
VVAAPGGGCGSGDACLEVACISLDERLSACEDGDGGSVVRWRAEIERLVFSPLRWAAVVLRGSDSSYMRARKSCWACWCGPSGS